MVRIPPSLDRPQYRDEKDFGLLRRLMRKENRNSLKAATSLAFGSHIKLNSQRGD